MKPKTKSAIGKKRSGLPEGEWRWKRLALSGTLAGTATATTALAGVVQISQVGNEVTSSADNLRADLTGDGVPDLPDLTGWGNPGTISTATPFTNQTSWRFHAYASAAFFDYGVVVTDSGTTTILIRHNLGQAKFSERGLVTASGGYGYRSYSVYLASAAGEFAGGVDASVRGLLPVTFSDARINGGATTNGFLEVHAFITPQTHAEHTVRLVRLVFDDAGTASPSGAVAGGVNPEFNPAIYSQRAARTAEITNLRRTVTRLGRQVRKARAKQRKARAADRAAQATREARKIKRLNRTLRQQRSRLNSLLGSPI